MSRRRRGRSYRENGTRCNLVEAAGIEPASEKVRSRASTRLAVSFFYLAVVPLSGKWVEGQPVHFALQLRALPEGYPQLSSPR
jgi:hypothetical protein